MQCRVQDGEQEARLIRCSISARKSSKHLNFRLIVKRSRDEHWTWTWTVVQRVIRILPTYRLRFGPPNRKISSGHISLCEHCCSRSESSTLLALPCKAQKHSRLHTNTTVCCDDGRCDACRRCLVVIDDHIAGLKGALCS